MNWCHQNKRMYKNCFKDFLIFLKENKTKMFIKKTIFLFVYFSQKIGYPVLGIFNESDAQRMFPTLATARSKI